jgi:hypothetical protein
MWNKHVLFTQNNIPSEDIRMDEYTGKQFFFIADPDDLPIEFYEKKQSFNYTQPIVHAN